MMSEQDMENINSVDESNHDIISTEMLEEIISSYDVVFEEIFPSALSYTERPYSEAMVMRSEVTYTPYATSSKEQNGNEITFTQFEEGNILT